MEHRAGPAGHAAWMRRALAEAEGVTIGAWDAAAALRAEIAAAISARAGEIAGILA